MFRTRIFRFLAAAACFLALTVPAKAVQVDCDSVYCFSPGDFSQEPSFSGICVTGLPDTRAGMLRLGNREIRAGDILTAEQMTQLTFSPLRTQEDLTATVQYLPIFENRVAPCSAVTIRIRGKEDKVPAAEDSALETYKNLPVTGKLKARDPEGLALTFSVTRQPKRGTLTVSEDGTFTYAPKKNKVGMDSFTYTAADPAGNVSREATVSITILKAAASTQYTDTAGRDCRFAAEWMKHTGIFVGESLGDQSCFQPDKTVTRGEFVTMLVKALDIPTDAQLTYTGYDDEIPTWLQPYLAAAIRSGLTADLPNRQQFGANTAITGAEAAVMLQNALDLSVPQQTVAQEDPGTPDWAQTSLEILRENGICLTAQDALTRAQAATVLYQSTKLAGESRSDTLV